MISKEHGLMVFSDAQPSEQLSSNLKDKYCIVAVLCENNTSLSSFKQYKDTEAKDRPEVANKLAEVLRVDKYNKAIGLFGNFDSIQKLGEDFLVTLPDNILEKYSKGYKIGTKKVHENIANFLPWFSLSLSLIGRQAANWAKRLEINKVTLVIDRLPSVPEPALEVLNIFNHHPEFFPLWKNIEVEFNVKFQITYMKSFQNDDKIEKDSNEHPCMILADWLAHSMYAALVEADELDDNAGRDKEYQEAIKKPYLTLYQDKRFTVLPVMNVVLNNS